MSYLSDAEIAGGIGYGTDHFTTENPYNYTTNCDGFRDEQLMNKVPSRYEQLRNERMLSADPIDSLPSMNSATEEEKLTVRPAARPVKKVTWEDQTAPAPPSKVESFESATNEPTLMNSLRQWDVDTLWFMIFVLFITLVIVTVSNYYSMKNVMKLMKKTIKAERET